MGKKKYDNGLLKTELSEDGKIINFSLKVSDLKWLFKNSNTNHTQNNVKRGKEQEFVDFVLSGLSELSAYDDTMVRWVIPFEEIFSEILEGYEEFVTYKE